MQRLGCKCPPPGYCFTIEHNKEYTPTDIDIEYCEQVEEMSTDSAIIQFKRLPAIPKVLCMKHVGPYERFYDSFIEAFRMCKFYPELMDELKRTLEAMEIDYYKPAVKCVRNRILNGKLNYNKI